MRSLLLASVCLLSSCSPGPARELIAPYEVGSVLPGGHRAATIELAESSFWQILTYGVTDGRHPPMTALLMHLTLPLGRSEWVGSGCRS